MKNIAVVCGGYSKESVISLRSAEQIASVIESDYSAYTVLITRDAWNAKIGDKMYPIDRNDFTFSLDGKKISFDAVFMAIHGTPGEDGMLQSYFDMLNIPYTTCNAFVSALTFNKFACKVFLKEYDILTADAILLRRNTPVQEQDLENRFGYPMFVKPNNGGSSFGVTKVKTRNDLLPAIERAFAEDNEVIIEPFIKGGEYTCGVFKTDKESIVFPPTEIVSKNEFFDVEAKYTPGMSEEITPARLPASQIKNCQELTSRIYDLLGCTGVVRIDYLMQSGKFYFMEINTVPGMSRESIIPKQTVVYGLPLKELYIKQINDALSRKK
ncbi:MAG: D-alanine--D-alanine ligase [Salinivirgaceae bacterium]|nr:D-alanine--D-alanine ligase [Salinivirgaceae bacterium]MBR5168229.1 D-alanine--D-alanine ligase [Salinivirgaceae bacterium]